MREREREAGRSGTRRASSFGFLLRSLSTAVRFLSYRRASFYLRLYRFLLPAARPGDLNLDVADRQFLDAAWNYETISVKERERPAKGRIVGVFDDEINFKSKVSVTAFSGRIIDRYIESGDFCDGVYATPLA